MDGPETGTVAGGHVLVHSLDGLSPRHLTVLLVHVVGTRAGVVSDPDAEVLDLQRVLLVDLKQKKLAWSAYNPPMIVTLQPRCLSPAALRVFGSSDSTYHVDGHDLTSGLLDLLQTPHEVPVSGLGDNGVGSEDSHTVQSRGGVGLCGQVSANDLVLVKTT